MRIKCLIYTGLCCGMMLHAQTLDWAPVGAKWYYEVSIGLSRAFVVFTVEKDTVFNNKTCKKIIIDTTITSMYQWIPKSTLPYVRKDTPKYALSFENNDTIYYYHWGCNKFVPHTFNFYDSISVGDIVDCNKIYRLPVIKIDTILWGNIKIKRIQIYGQSFDDYYIDYGYYFNFENSYLWNIGWIGNGLIPISPYIIDAFGMGSLRCYYHPVYGWLQYDTSVECDEIILKTPDYVEMKDNLKIYTNNNKIYIKTTNDQYPLKLKISNILGMSLNEELQIYDENTSVDVEGFSNQILVLSIQNKNQNLIMKKILIQ